jgi:A/G-specific adenine glycosylase
MIPQQHISDFQKKILDWYHENQRELPWRKTRDPYRILISEVMSQQTQLSRVVPKYEAWIVKFPTIDHLAAAKVSEVLHLWSGLGYNRRALNLKKTAEIIVEKYKGKFPRTEKELLTLPGIGLYTARAVLCFAFDEQVAVVDTNVRKVILTQLFETYRHCEEERRSNPKEETFHERDCRAPTSLAMTNQEVAQIAEKLLPQGKAYEWNQALMDYAAAVLKNEKIPIPKQSKFIGSHRYYRGQILKQLLQKKKIAVKDIGLLIKKDYQESEKEWLQKLLDELLAEGFIICNKNTITLAA